ncbi:plasma membrane proline transmembrane transporter Put4 [Schizosaccharomyces pombe]|uniref:Probable proline-specific permease put4 n=1 Tax=Schizosaccharomyces pombe (strain 972 / ATCC 24843) TaxID=284812 RepID=PUT4_SCHPO|nr:putative proline specific plasma membrane permease Put4 [Schizosaccharomyces pombe]Q9URZ3.1 RecName: Full=Probable proline-specific permease put4 [Schizosaccharomyces pombe 972h-]CAB60020.1 proline specific plasma membrane permease Put4 (predicted) [Schizosaccharomyces pombe]|eukprot:NP_595009.1 putative proline specific plasma membrane permease Put4 [Schizosaccharomyces pombe]
MDEKKALQYEESKRAEEITDIELVSVGGIDVEKKYGETKRALKSRHVQLIAIGGCIGTGLFVGSGSALSESGPASLFLSYVIMSFVIWTVMNALGEMCTYLPLSGASPITYIERYVDASLAFAAGWNYWYAYVFLVASEVTAASIVIEYWTYAVPTAGWIAILLFLVAVLNSFFVKWFGETEFWFAIIKVIAIVGLIILGVVIFFGGTPKHDRLGFRYWKHGLAFREYIVKGASGRFVGFWSAVIKSGFAFILAPELVIFSAGETEAPRRNIPKATSRFIYRLIFFYIFGSLTIGVITSSKDPRLLNAISSGASGAAASPFVIGIQNAEIPVLNHIINAVILTSACSSGNSFLFAGSRSIYSLAKEHQAPKIFKYCNRWGVPVISVAVTVLFACLAFLNASASAAVVFNWFCNLSTISGFLAWICVLVAYLQFRKAMILNNLWETRPYKTPFQPYATYLTLFLLALITLTNGFTVFVGHTFTAGNFIAAYITLPIFLVLYVAHKLWSRNWSFGKRIEEIDVTTGVAEAEALEQMYPAPVPRNIIEKIWFWIA